MESRNTVTPEKSRLYYGIIIVGASFMNLILGGGLTYSFGVFFEPLLGDFGWTRAITSGAFSLFMIVNGLSCIVTGRINDKFGSRVLLTVLGSLFSLGYFLMSQVNTLWQLYIFYGVMIAIGSGNVVPIISTTVRWYTKRRGIMTGIAMSGVGVGTMLIPLFANWLIYHFDWRISYMIIGGGSLILHIVLAQFYQRKPAPEGMLSGSPDMEYGVKAQSSGTTDIELSSAVRTRQFWQMCLIILCNMLCAQAIMVHFVIHALDLNFTPTNAASLMTIIGGFSFCGRIITGFFCDRVGAKAAMIVSSSIVAVSLILLSSSTQEWTVYLFAVMFGFAYGGSAALPSLLAGELFGLKAHGVILGIMMFFGTVGGAAGPVLMGYVYDIVQSYQLAFIGGGVISAVAAGLALLLKPLRNHKSDEQMKMSVQ